MLKADRFVFESEIHYACDVVATNGMGLVLNTAGSGVALGDSRGHVTLAANPSGNTFMGVLMNDVVNIDLTRYHLNFNQDQTVVGAPCNMLKKGRVTVNNLDNGITPVDGSTAYLSLNGNFTNVPSATGGLVATPKAGQFRSKVDANGYATIEFNLPNY